MPIQPPAATPHRHHLFDNAYLILILTVAFWGGNVVAGKAAVGHVDPMALTTLRMLGAFLAILPFSVSPLRRDWPLLASRWPLFVFYGAIGFSAFNLLIYLASHHISGVNAALDQVTINILVMLANFVFFRTRVRALQLVGVVLTIAGVVVTATHGDVARILSLDINIGDAMVLLACVGYAAYSLLLRYRPTTDWRSFVAVTFATAFITAVIFQVAIGALGPMLESIPNITPLGWGIVAYTILFPSLISQILYVRGVELIGANRASLFINLIPLFGAVGSVLVLGEILQPFHLVAAALIMAGIVLAEWSARR